MTTIITEYRVVYQDSLPKLIQSVNEFLEAGWRPQGRISISISDGGDVIYEAFAQAVIRNTPISPLANQ